MILLAHDYQQPCIQRCPLWKQWWLISCLGSGSTPDWQVSDGKGETRRPFGGGWLCFWRDKLTNKSWKKDAFKIGSFKIWRWKTIKIKTPFVWQNHFIMETPGKFPSSVSRFTSSSQPRYGSLDGRTRHGTFSPAIKFCHFCCRIFSKSQQKNESSQSRMRKRTKT